MVKFIFCRYKDKDGRQYPPDSLPESLRKLIATAMTKGHAPAIPGESLFSRNPALDFNDRKNHN